MESQLSQASKDNMQALAEAKFKRKEMQQRDGLNAMAEYHADKVAERKKTAKLREQRLAKEAAEAKAAASEKRAEARAKGYEGEACGECGNFTLVRNGTCMKCDTCGGTTGCS